MERHAGVESLVGWIKRECLEEIRGRRAGPVTRSCATTAWNCAPVAMGWSSKLATALRPRPAPWPATCQVGARSAAGRLRGRARAPGGAGEAQLPERSRHVCESTTELYARYKDEQKTLTAARAEALAKAKRQKDRAIENAKKRRPPNGRQSK